MPRKLIERMIRVIVLSVFFAAPAVFAQSSKPPKLLLALSKHDHTLTIVDPTTLKVLARAPVGPDLHQVIASSDGKTAYVSIYGGGRYHSLSVIDLVSNTPLPEIDTGALNGPHGLAFAGGKVWFTAEGAKAIGRYDPGSARIDWILGTGQNRTHMIFVKSDENEIYTTNVSSATVTILEKVALPPAGPPGEPPPSSGAASVPSEGGDQPRMDWNETTSLSEKETKVSMSRPMGAQDGTLSIIDIAAKKVISTLNAKVVSANRLNFTPDGKLVLISSLRNGDLVIYDTKLRKEFKRVNIGHGAAGILIDPDGSRAFVACTPDNYIAIVDLKTLAVTRHLDVGGEPDGLAWAVRP